MGPRRRAKARVSNKETISLDLVKGRNSSHDLASDDNISLNSSNDNIRSLELAKDEAVSHDLSTESSSTTNRSSHAKALRGKAKRTTSTPSTHHQSSDISSVPSTGKSRAHQPTPKPAPFIDLSEVWKAVSEVITSAMSIPRFIFKKLLFWAAVAGISTIIVGTLIILTWHTMLFVFDRGLYVACTQGGLDRLSGFTYNHLGAKTDFCNRDMSDTQRFEKVISGKHDMTGSAIVHAQRNSNLSLENAKIQSQKESFKVVQLAADVDAFEEYLPHGEELRRLASKYRDKHGVVHKMIANLTSTDDAFRTGLAADIELLTGWMEEHVMDRASPGLISWLMDLWFVHCPGLFRFSPAGMLIDEFEAFVAKNQLYTQELQTQSEKLSLAVNEWSDARYKFRNRKNAEWPAWERKCVKYEAQYLGFKQRMILNEEDPSCTDIDPAVIRTFLQVELEDHVTWSRQFAENSESAYMNLLGHYRSIYDTLERGKRRAANRAYTLKMFGKILNDVRPRLLQSQEALEMGLKGEDVPSQIGAS